MKIIYICAILSAFPAIGYGISCYECFHSTDPEDNANGVSNNEACRTADARYLKVCTRETPVPWSNAEGKHKKHFKLSNASSVAVDEKQAVQFSCVDTVGTYDGYNFAGRGCLAQAPNECVNFNENGWKERTCVCNTDGCNKNTSSDSSHLKASICSLLIAIYVAIQIYC